MKKIKKHKVYTTGYAHMFEEIPDAAGPIYIYNSVAEIKNNITHWKEVGIFKWDLVEAGYITNPDFSLACQNAKTMEEWAKVNRRNRQDPEYKEYLRLKKKFE